MEIAKKMKFKRETKSLIAPQNNNIRNVSLCHCFVLLLVEIGGDLGINSKNSQPDIDSSAARYKMYKRVATHKAPRIHPVKNQKKEK